MNLEPLLYWATEREAIRVRKERDEPWPWTTDPILQQYSFCCLRREDDRVTRWIDQNIRKPYADNQFLWWMLLAARQINWPDSLGELITVGAWPDQPGFRPAYVAEVLLARAAHGEKWHTGAYLIRPESSPETLWFSWPKAKYIAEIVLGYPWEQRALFAEHFSATPTLEATVNLLRQFRNFGPFMAYQSVVDMRFTKLLSNAVDRESWAAAGPGTIRGLNRLAGRPIKTPLKQSEALEEIRAIYPVLKKLIPAIDFSDIPNALCETDKYLRVKKGEGRPRAIYWRYKEASKLFT